LIPLPSLGPLARPLSALVFNFSQYTSRASFHPCEAAFLSCISPQFTAARPITVTVLVSPSNYLSLKEAYTQIPGVNVRPLLIRPEDLNIASMLTLMSVDQSSQPPLYMSQVTKILRDMASASSSFDFLEFKRRIAELDIMPLQRKPLEQRMDLLESFLDLSPNPQETFSTSLGGLTIVDLSCPFVDENTACVLFNICLGLFMSDSTPARGKVLAVDEAHRYLSNTPASRTLTASLTQLIRQQRHCGARIIIATQEPTIDSRLLALCSATLIHRFNSPEWFAMLKKHLSQGAQEEEIFEKIANLRVGEGLLFAPSAIIGKGEEGGVKKLGAGCLEVKVRKRITADGGRSIECV